jgi:SAM-dependent methyltransferase
MQRKIIDYHQDEVQDWVADLECGHKQHLRHDPPWFNRPWVVSSEGRRSRLGAPLDCKLCDTDATGGYDAEAFIAEFYDHVVPYANRQDVAFFVAMAQCIGGPVLEMGCGTGRVLIPTAQAGVEIVGLDASPRMLAVCQANLARQPEAVQGRVKGLVHEDMRQFDLGQTFGLVTMPFRPFQHLLTVEDQLACLTAVHRHLADMGTLILDLFNPSLVHLLDHRYLREYGEEPAFVLADGRRVVRRHRHVSRDLFRQVLDMELLYYVTHPGGHQERLVHCCSMRYLFRFEAEHLLARCGFRVAEVFADYDKSPFGTKDPSELIIVARKI